MFKDMNDCMNCNIPFQEDDMTGEMFESLSENDKQQYADQILQKIINSDIFDKESFKKHHEGANLYQCWWFDKYEELGGKFSARYETDEQRKKRLDEQYGKDSQAYQQAIVEQCIEADRSKKQESSNIPKCPTCGSTNIKRITGTERAVSILGLGVFSKKINKSYKCVKCKSTW